MSVTAELIAAEAPLPVLSVAPRPGVIRRALQTAHGRVGFALIATAGGAALLAPWLAPADPFALVGPALAAPSLPYPMGTDALGRDLLSGVLFGARTSLMVALAVVTVSLLVGASVGLVAGYRGGWVDDVLMRATELVQVLPRFFLAVLVIALFGPGLDRLIVILGLSSWPILARVVRAEVLSLREQDFVRAAEALGASDLRILMRELLPNVLPGALVIVGLLLAQVLLLEASLGFLGLGDPNHMSWGALAGQAQPYLLRAWWLPLFPGLAITATVLGFNLLGDALALGAQK